MQHLNPSCRCAAVVRWIGSAPSPARCEVLPMTESFLAEAGYGRSTLCSQRSCASASRTGVRTCAFPRLPLETAYSASIRFALLRCGESFMFAHRCRGRTLEPRGADYMEEMQIATDGSARSVVGIHLFGCFLVLFASVRRRSPWALGRRVDFAALRLRRLRGVGGRLLFLMTARATSEASWRR